MRDPRCWYGMWGVGEKEGDRIGLGHAGRERGVVMMCMRKRRMEISTVLQAVFAQTWW